ncbi:MAG: hypothetical protein IPI67_31145 [Myxococcales bacterium]|nr:hypothetical protein [Myxococcales bacterium]
MLKPDGEVSDDTESSFGCGHILLLEIAVWIVAIVVWCVVGPLLTPTVVLALVAIGIIAPLAAAAVMVIRGRRRRRRQRAADQPRIPRSHRDSQR